MKPAAFGVVALGAMLVGCAAYVRQPPPGPSPIPRPWQPERALRARVQPSTRPGVVLDDRNGLSPDEAAVLALDHNPRLRAIRAERGIAQAELLSAGVLPNPRVAASIDAPVSGPDPKVLGYGVGLSWNVSPLFSRHARVAAAEQNARSVDLDVAWQEWRVAQAARLHAIRAIYLQRRVAIARDAERTWQQRLTELRKARAAQAITEPEVTDAERSVADAKVSRLQLQQKLVVEETALDQALGVDPRKTPTLDTSWAPPSQVPAGDELLAELPRRRLDLLALQHAQQSHDEALRAAVLARFPPIELGVRMERDVEQAQSVGVTLSFSIPSFDRNQGTVREQKVRRRQVAAEYAARLLAARADVVRIEKEIPLVEQELGAARAASQAAEKLADQARAAVAGGAMSPLYAADLFERATQSRLRALRIEQTLAELRLALAISAGVDW